MFTVKAHCPFMAHDLCFYPRAAGPVNWVYLNQPDWPALGARRRPMSERIIQNCCRRVTSFHPTRSTRSIRTILILFHWFSENLHKPLYTD